MTVEEKQKVKEYYLGELKKCKTDALYFAIKYCMIIHQDLGKINFKMFDYQKECVDAFQKFRFNIVLKARQLGLSTTVAMYALHLMLFKPGSRIAIVANKRSTAKELLDKVKVMWEALPEWMGGPKPKDKNMLKYCKVYNKYEFEMFNGSKIEAFSSSSDATRSISATLLIFDEAAFIENAEEVYGGAQSTITSSENSKIIILSTPNMSFGFFYDKWQETQEGKSIFNAIKLKWNRHPNRDKVWREQENKLNGRKKAARENDCVFDVTGDTVYDSEEIQYLEDKYVIPPIEKRGANQEYWIWEYPKPGHTYFSVIDCATGDGQDFSTISIIDALTFELAAEFVGDLPPTGLVKMAVQTGIEYNESLLIIERTGEAGGATVQELSHVTYKNVFKMPNDASTTDFDSFMKNSNRPDEEMKVGVSTNSATRPIYMSKFNTYIAKLCDREINPSTQPNIIKSSRVMREFRSFIWKNGKAQAAKGQHDDLIIPRAIACGLKETALNFQTKLNEMMRSSFKNVQVYKPYENFQLPNLYGQQTNNPYKMSVSNGIGGFTNEDMSWLLDR